MSQRVYLTLTVTVDNVVTDKEGLLRLTPTDDLLEWMRFALAAAAKSPMYGAVEWVESFDYLDPVEP